MVKTATADLHGDQTWHRTKDIAIKQDNTWITFVDIRQTWLKLRIACQCRDLSDEKWIFGLRSCEREVRKIAIATSQWFQADDWNHLDGTDRSKQITIVKKRIIVCWKTNCGMRCLFFMFNPAECLPSAFHWFKHWIWPVNINQYQFESLDPSWTLG